MIVAPQDEPRTCHDGRTWRWALPMTPAPDACGTYAFFVRPRIVDTHAPLPHAMLQGPITTEQASSMPLQS